MLLSLLTGCAPAVPQTGCDVAPLAPLKTAQAPTGTVTNGALVESLEAQNAAIELDNTRKAEQAKQLDLCR